METVRVGAGAFEIRRLAEVDLALYKSLRDTVLAEQPDAFTSDAAQARRLDASSYADRLGDDRPEGGHFTFGAWRDGSLLGAVSAERERRVKARHIARIVGMMVRGDAARQGIGTALLLAALDAARRAEGVEMLTLNVTATNLSAVRLYERAGFVRYARLERAIRVGDRYFTKDQMVLVL